MAQVWPDCKPIAQFRLPTTRLGGSQLDVGIDARTHCDMGYSLKECKHLGTFENQEMILMKVKRMKFGLQLCVVDVCSLHEIAILMPFPLFFFAAP
ncbi:hypothetical protein VNO77_42150 [Canavalia gladiata]|uniref:Uncharacterized protein n=1 Tax=Canavalia gladiata TaxID=3824 RepID=A0AAN9PSK7_CANGL